MKLNKLLFASVLILLAILYRTIWHMGENIEFVTTATLLASFYLGKKWSVIVPLAILVITDAIIGNTSIFLFTWSAYLSIGVVSYYVNRSKKINVLPKAFTSMLYAGAGSLWFFLWTNFGVWLLDTHHMYEKDMGGLLKSYVMGIPFLKNNITGNLFFVFVSVFLVELAVNHLSQFRFLSFNIKKNHV